MGAEIENEHPLTHFHRRPCRQPGRFFRTRARIQILRADSRASRPSPVARRNLPDSLLPRPRSPAPRGGRLCAGTAYSRLVRCRHFWYNHHMKPQNLSTNEVAAQLGITQSGLQRLIRERRVPAPRLQKLGKVAVRLWTKADIEKLKIAVAAQRGRRSSRHLSTARESVGDRPYKSFADRRTTLTPAEVADWLRVPESWVYEKTRRRCPNPLPCWRIGKYVRFSKYAIQQWLEKQTANMPEA